jgi:hypothetical protein
MTAIVTNIDGTYLANDPRDFCRHGVYVGGCGYDFMCGACEMGDPDLTLREAIAWANREIDDFFALWDTISGIENVDAEAVFDNLAGVTSNYFSTLRRALDTRDEIARLSCGLDDDKYLYRQRAARVLAWTDHT